MLKTERNGRIVLVHLRNKTIKIKLNPQPKQWEINPKWKGRDWVVYHPNYTITTEMKELFKVEKARSVNKKLPNDASWEEIKSLYFKILHHRPRRIFILCEMLTKELQQMLHKALQFGIPAGVITDFPYVERSKEGVRIHPQAVMIQPWINTKKEDLFKESLAEAELNRWKWQNPPTKEPPEELTKRVEKLNALREQWLEENFYCRLNSWSYKKHPHNMPKTESFQNPTQYLEYTAMNESRTITNQKWAEYYIAKEILPTSACKMCFPHSFNEEFLAYRYCETCKKLLPAHGSKCCNKPTTPIDDFLLDYEQKYFNALGIDYSGKQRRIHQLRGNWYTNQLLELGLNDLEEDWVWCPTCNKPFKLRTRHELELEVHGLSESLEPINECSCGHRFVGQYAFVDRKEDAQYHQEHLPHKIKITHKDQ